MNLYDKIAVFGRKLRQDEKIAEVDIRVKMSNGAKVLWCSYNDENRF